MTIDHEKKTFTPELQELRDDGGEIKIIIIDTPPAGYTMVNDDPQVTHEH
jgi:hypothetical protein